ncbi:MAG: hypothetical protein Q4C96_10785 [Planctomycetia bacterium]|nr:hypothetical protein [Planctomycetia bacterium]
MSMLHNTVSIGAGGTFTLQGKTAGTLANLYVGYQDCNTTNVTTGTLDLTNASEATLQLDKLYVGYKTELESSDPQRRTAASEGLLILGDNATVEANEIWIGYKNLASIPPADSSKYTRGKLTMGGTSTVETDVLHLGNNKNDMILSYSYLELEGESQFTVNNGAYFYDNIDLTMSGSSQMLINHGTATQTMDMYADMKMILSENAKFTIDGSTASKKNQIRGYLYSRMGGNSQFLLKGDSYLTQHAIFLLGGNALFDVEGNMEFHAGDVIIKETDQADVEKRGTLYFSAVSNARYHIDGNLTSYGQNAFSITAEDTAAGYAMHITGDATFDSTQHLQTTYTVQTDGTLVKTGETNLTGKSIEFNAEKGTTYIAGNTTVKGTLDLNVTGGKFWTGGNTTVTGVLDLDISDGIFQTTDLILNAEGDSTTHVDVTVTGGLLQVEHAYRDNVGGGITFNIDLAGGKVIAQTVGVQEGQPVTIEGERPFATLNFHGGTLVVDVLGSDHTPYYLDQTVHTYGTSTDLVSVLSPGDDGKYGSTTIVGKTYSDDTQHAYNIADGTIRLDMGTHGRDNLIVVGSMQMSNAAFDIHVSGSVPISGFEEKDGETIAFVTLATATEFYKGDGSQLFPGDFAAGEIAQFNWVGDDTQWRYYISELITPETSPSSSGQYELRAYRIARPDEIPEPGTLTLMLLGLVFLEWKYRKCSPISG